VTPSAPLAAAAPRRHAWFKAALFALLAGNAAAYVVSGTLAEAVDALAWLTLLILFELETGFGFGSGVGWTARAARAARLVAAVAVVVAAAGYAREEEWLDAINAALWLGIVIVLEWQVRFPAMAMRHRPACTIAAGALYAGLGGLVVAWMVQGEWFDAYDALLWLAALIVIEMDILRHAARSGQGQWG